MKAAAQNGFKTSCGLPRTVACTPDPASGERRGRRRMTKAAEPAKSQAASRDSPALLIVDGCNKTTDDKCGRPYVTARYGERTPVDRSAVRLHRSSTFRGGTSAGVSHPRAIRLDVRAMSQADGHRSPIVLGHPAAGSPPHHERTQVAGLRTSRLFEPPLPKVAARSRPPVRRRTTSLRGA